MRKGRMVAALLTVVAVLATAGCQSSSAADSASRTESNGHVAYLNMPDFGGGTNPQVNFNPFLSTNLWPTSLIYEPLYETNSYNCDETPWLGTAYQWLSPTQLQVTVRHGVKWSDGQPLTAQDVAYTYNLALSNAALDRFGISTYISKANVTGSDQVVFDLKEPAYQELSTLLNVPIVPEHVFSKQSNVQTFVNATPVGTGPYLYKSMNPQQLLMERNPHYWGGDIKVDELRFQKSNDQQMDQLKLAQGGFDVNFMFVPDIEKTYVSKDPKHFTYWTVGSTPISLFMNLSMAPFNDVKFRQAMVYAIDREAILKQIRVDGLTPASQTALITPNQDAYIDPSIPNKGVYPYDPAKADQMLTAAGYVKNSSGQRLMKDGTPMSFEFLVPQGWSDWTSAANEVKNDLGKLGIEINTKLVDPAVHDQDRAMGNYQMMFGVRGGQCSMLDTYAGALDSRRSAPVGQNASYDEERWSDPTTNALIDQLAQAQTPDQVKPIVYQLEHIMIDQVPFVPLWYGAQQAEFNTTNVVGWPSAKDPYTNTSNFLVMSRYLHAPGYTPPASEEPPAATSSGASSATSSASGKQ